MRFLSSFGMILFLLLTVQVFNASPCLRAGESASPPNIVYIMLDEWAYFEMSCMGNELLETPVIDRMAAEGLRFTQCLAGGNVCASTRSSLMASPPRRERRPPPPSARAAPSSGNTP